MTGLSSWMAQHPAMAAFGNAAPTVPWAAAYRILINRSVERREANGLSDIETIVQIVPSMMAYRSIVLRKSFEKKFLIALVDEVVLPALGITKTNASQRKKK